MSRTENNQNYDKKRDSKASRQRAFITAYFKNAFKRICACRDCGINRSTFKKWMAEDSKFVEELHAATDARLDEAEGAILEPEVITRRTNWNTWTSLTERYRREFPN
jgi:hypothetical protein